MSNHKVVDISQDGDWIRQNRNKPSIQHIVSEYKKHFKVQKVDIFDAVAWWKEKNPHKQIKLSSIVNRLVAETLEEKVWTKPEWEAYKKEHPGTQIRPKFNKPSKKNEINKPNTQQTNVQQVKPLSIEESAKIFLSDESAQKEIIQRLGSSIKIDGVDGHSIVSHITDSLKSIQISNNTTPNEVIEHVFNSVPKGKKVSLAEISNLTSDGMDVIGGVVKKVLNEKIFTTKPNVKVDDSWRGKRHDVQPESSLEDVELGDIKKSALGFKKELATEGLYRLKLIGQGAPIGKTFERMLQQSDSAVELRKATENQFDNMTFEDDKIEKSYKYFAKEIAEFSASGYQMQMSAELSNKIAQTFGIKGESDWRMKKFNVEPTEISEEEKEGIRLQMKKEQTILRESGLVDKDGYLTVYRSASIDGIGKPGDNVELKGNFIESWAIKPQTFGKTCFKARVHVSQVVSSCIGNHHYSFTEAEVMLMGHSVKATIQDKIKMDDIHAEELKSQFSGYSDLSKAEGVEKNKIPQTHPVHQELKNIETKENPTPQDINKMKQVLGEKTKNMTPQQLIILFKTLAKRGYFSEE